MRSQSWLSQQIAAENRKLRAADVLLVPIQKPSTDFLTRAQQELTLSPEQRIAKAKARQDRALAHIEEMNAVADKRRIAKSYAETPDPQREDSKLTPVFRISSPSTQVDEGTPRTWFAEEGMRSQLEDFARDTTRDSDEAMRFVEKRIRRCKSKSRAGFVAWACSQIAKSAGDHFHLKAGAIKKFDIGVADLLANAMANGLRYTDFPAHEYDDAAGLYRVNMGTAEDPIVWTVPDRLWNFAIKLWPMHLRKSRSGYYLTKYTGGEEVTAHRLVLQPSPMDTVCSMSGNLLDWSSLFVKPYQGGRKGYREGMRTYRNPETGDLHTPQSQWEKDRIRTIAPVVTDDGQELSGIENIAADDMRDVCGENISVFGGGSPYRRKVQPNVDLGNVAYERNETNEGGEELRTLVNTERRMGEED